MAAKNYLRSFAGGEIAPELFGRLDLVKNITGLARCLNFMVLPHGPISNRGGLEHVLETKDSSKKSVLLPFIYSTTQSYVLEFGDQYLRIHTNGAAVLDAAQNITGISAASPAVVTYNGADNYPNGSWVYISGITAGPTQLNGRFVKTKNLNAGANTFEITDLAGVDIDTSAMTAWSAGGTLGRVYEVTTPYLEADLFDLHFTQSADVLTITHPTYQQRQLSRLGAASWSLATFTCAPTIATPAAPTLATSGAGAVTYYYKTTALATGTLEESLASAAADITNDLTGVGAYIDVTPAVVATAVRYNVYKKGLGGIYGYIGQSDGTALRDNNITPDLTQTPPEGTDPFVGANNYPGAVGYFGGRRYFAGTNNQQQNLWGTRSATESNMLYSIPSRDDDRIAVRLTSRQANRIRHLVPLGSLLLLTSGAEWEVTTKNSDAITPNTIDYKSRGSIGANNVQPIVVSDAVLYAQARGGRVREMKSTDTSVYGIYASNDISIMSPHLFDGYTVTSMAYTHAPHKVAWFVRSDGVMLALTYVPEHQVAAWHQHNTDGLFESVASVPEGNEDVLYAVVKRVINGRTVRNVERMRPRLINRLQDAFFVDDGLSFSNTIAATLTPGAGATVAGTADVVFTAGSAVFASGDVGRFIHYDYTTIDDEGQTVYERAVAEITTYTDTTHVSARIDAAWPSLSAIASAGWRMTVTTVSGFWHLIGETVSVLTDGAVHPQKVVSATGTITLDQPASIGCAGLPYNADAITMPLAVEMEAFSQSVKKNVNRVALRVNESSGVFVGPSFAKLKEAKQRTDEAYGVPPNRKTGIARVMTTPSWSDDGQLCIRQSNPLPLTVVALVPDVAYGG